MDPVATRQRILDAVKDQDRDEALSALSDLTTWLVNGGFEPPEWPEDEFFRLQKLVGDMFDVP